MEQALTAQGMDMTVVTTDDDGPGKHASVTLGQPIKTPHSTRWYFRKQTEFYKLSFPLARWLKRHVKEFDLVHIHALFSYSSLMAARAARQSGVPYVIRPLGVLNKWGLENRRAWLKAFSFRYVEKPILRHAAAMHYTSEQERMEAEAAGASAKAYVIPLGIDLSAFQSLPAPELFFARWPQARGKKLVLFLSRLDAKKGVELLLKAWATIYQASTIARQSEWLLVIAGKGEANYESQLKEMANQSGIAEQVIWTGFLEGTDKLAALSAASIFVLPSYSENFGIALVEAMAAGRACITAEGVAISEDLREERAGLVVQSHSESIVDALQKLMNDVGLCASLGKAAKKLTQERFSLAAMGKALKTSYRDIYSAIHD